MLVTIFRKHRRKNVCVEMDQAEAILLIKSLAAQIESKSANVGREEFMDEACYFSVFVRPGERRK